MSKIKNCEHCLCFATRVCPVCRKKMTDWKKEMGHAWDHYVYLYKTWCKMKRLAMYSTGSITVDQELYQLFGIWSNRILSIILLMEVLPTVIARLGKLTDCLCRYNLGRGVDTRELEREMTERNFKYTYKEGKLIIINIGEQKWKQSFLDSLPSEIKITL